MSLHAFLDHPSHSPPREAVYTASLLKQFWEAKLEQFWPGFLQILPHQGVSQPVPTVSPGTEMDAKSFDDSKSEIPDFGATSPACSSQIHRKIKQSHTRDGVSLVWVRHKQRHGGDTKGFRLMRLGRLKAF